MGMGMRIRGQCRELDVIPGLAAAASSAEPKAMSAAPWSVLTARVLLFFFNESQLFHEHWRCQISSVCTYLSSNILGD